MGEVQGADTQREDVSEIFPGPILLLAGPGTGKTYQLARRVKWLVEQRQVAPNQITVMTFTDEAARNMRERLSDPAQQEVYLPLEMQPPRMCTMHSLAYEMIRSNHEALGFKETPRLVPEHLVGTLLEDAAQLVGLPRDVGKQRTEPCRRNGRCERADARDECKVCDSYRQILRAHNALDYDDQIFLACHLLRENGEIARSYQEGAVHLLVDEYQDINAAQYGFIRLLAGEDAKGMYAVGDDNQSIYSWRGGTPQYVRDFRNHWPSAHVARLDESYRCPRPVLDAAAAVIVNGCTRFSNDPRIRSRSSVKALVRVHRVPSDGAEASHIAHTILQARGTRDALILIPRAQYAPPIKRALRARGIPYDCRTRVEGSGLHVLNELMRWVGDETDNFALRECLQRMVENPDLPLGQPKKGKVTEWREEILSKISHLWSHVQKRRSTLFMALRRQSNGAVLAPLLAHVEELRSAAERAPHEFLEVATRILRPWAETDACGAEVTEWVDDCRSRNRAGGRPAARVLTMASAKGLQADMVFVVGLEKGSFPYPSATGEDLEEQYRLLYVSMTRAKEELHLYSARKRSGAVSYRRRASGTYQPGESPDFLDWLPEGSFERLEHWPRKRTSKAGHPKTE